MTSDERIQNFDPNGPVAADSLWGLPFDVDTAALVVIPVPWEVTVSYGTGTAGAPSAVLAASSQVDLENDAFPGAWKRGVAMAPERDDVKRLNAATRPKALGVIQALARDSQGVDGHREALESVNRACETMVSLVRRDAAGLLDRGKLVGVLGGDHSVALGLIQELAERHPGFGILHVDAHCDLRNAYEGFVHSHASIMRNALELDGLATLVQVGVRDYCEEEVAVVDESAGAIRLYTDRALSIRSFGGDTWASVADEIIGSLPVDVYVSFDVDGLDPSLCPGTGTPVPGGLAYEQALYLVEQIRATERNIIGFDLCEVSASSEWDANVGARLLYRLSSAALAR